MLAAQMFEDGTGPAEVARRLGVTTGAASQWKKAWTENGKEGLRSVPHPGSKPKLPREKLPQLERLLLQGPKAHGFSTELWTLGRIREVIKQHFGVTYDESQISRILRSMNWSRQKPERRARERDEKQVQLWIEQDWPRIKKGL